MHESFMYSHTKYTVYVQVVVTFVAAGRRRGLSIDLNNFLQVISTESATLNVSDVYTCQGIYGPERFFGVGSQVSVRGKPSCQ